MGAFAYHIAVNVVLVGMMVRVNRETIACSGAKQREVGGVRADRLGLAVAADVVEGLWVFCTSLFSIFLP